MVDPADVAAPDRDRVATVLRRVRLEEVRDADSRAFHAAYDLLATAFYDSGELEERETLAGFVRDRWLRYSPGLEGIYHLVTAWDGDTLVGVRDCYVDVDAEARVCVVGLAHVYVTPAWRRTGLAAALRAVPITLARSASHSAGLPTLVVAEMEPVDPADPETVIRLLAYGRAGFGVFDPRRLRYSQVEFRDLEGAAHTAQPMLAVVRPMGVESLTPEVVASFPRIFYATHRGFVPGTRVDPSEAWLDEHLWASSEPVALLPLPVDAHSLERLAPLVRGAVLPLYPPGLRGEDPTFGDPGEELARVRTAFAGGTRRG